MDFLRFLAAWRHPVFDVIFQNITFLAQEFVVISVISWLYWCHDKKLGYTLGFSYFFSGLLVQGLKITFRIPRPWMLDPDFHPVASAVPGATGYSFPSGHTQSATALYSCLGFSASGKLRKFLWFALIVLIGFSRMYLGVHTPKDVLTACVLTLIVCILFSRRLAGYLFVPQYVLRITALLAGCCTLLLIYGTILRKTGQADPAMTLDALKAACAGFGFALGYYLERTRIRFDMPQGTRSKLLRFLFGILGLLLLRAAASFTIKKFLIGNLFSYTLLILWITAIYPALFTRRKR